MTHNNRPWRRLVNTAANKGGSIHDDGQAQELGFRGAFVPGSVVACAAIPLILEQYGSGWMEGGWFEFTFVTPVYDAEEVQATAVNTGSSLDLAVTTRDGRLCCAGTAGPGFRKPWEETATDWGDVFPHLSRDFAFPSQNITIRYEDVEEMLNAAGDDTSWYQHPSPWGEPIAPPEWILPLALHTMAGTHVPIDEAKGPGIWARHQLAIREPLRYDTPYSFHQRIAGKGDTERTCFLDYDFEVHADDRVLLAGRHRGKFLKTAS